MVDYREMDLALGTATDKSVAGWFGVSESTVRKRRYRLGIDRYTYQGNFDWMLVDHLIGELPDMMLAYVVGCSRERIRQRREELNLKPMRMRGMSERLKRDGVLLYALGKKENQEVPV